MTRFRRLRGVAAMSAAALATLSVAGPASADDHVACVNLCEPVRPTGTENASWKLANKGFPGNTLTVFSKVELNSFGKLESKDFPGATDGVFDKHVE